MAIDNETETNVFSKRRPWGTLVAIGTVIVAFVAILTLTSSWVNSALDQTRQLDVRISGNLIASELGCQNEQRRLAITVNDQSSRLAALDAQISLVLKSLDRIESKLDK